jgi:hypothetical protein
MSKRSQREKGNDLNARMRRARGRSRQEDQRDAVRESAEQSQPEKRSDFDATRDLKRPAAPPGLSKRSLSPVRLYGERYGTEALGWLLKWRASQNKTANTYVIEIPIGI